MFPQPNDCLVVCPFNKSHHILRSRIQYHIVKCKKNHPTCNKIICPYDATEYLEPEDYPRHLFECKMKKTIDVQKYAEDKMYKNKNHGRISEAPFHYPNLIQPDEDWSEGVKPPVTTLSETTNTWNSSVTEQPIITTQLETTWNSSLTNKPKNISSQGRGKLLKDYLDELNNKCDGLYCTKPCCPKNIKSKGRGRGEVLKKFLNESANLKPLGRAAMLKIYWKNNLDSKNQGTSGLGFSTNSLKPACDDEKFRNVDSEDEI